MDSKTVWHWEHNRSRPLRWMMLAVGQFLGNAPTDPSPDTLGMKLMAYRRSLGLSQEQMARALGVHKTTVVRWETGRRRPSKAAEQKLANHLKLGP